MATGLLGDNDTAKTPGGQAPGLRVTTVSTGGKRYIGQLIGLKKRERAKQQNFQKKDFLKK